jgi:hypothetical protein
MSVLIKMRDWETYKMILKLPITLHYKCHITVVATHHRSLKVGLTKFSADPGIAERVMDRLNYVSSIL